jgi:hypothetical protein
LLRVQDKFGVHHFPRRGAVDITVGEPIWPSGTEWPAAAELQRTARNAVLDLSGNRTSNDKRMKRPMVGRRRDGNRSTIGV